MRRVEITPTVPDAPERQGRKDLEDADAHSSQITADYKQEALTINIPLEAAEISGSPHIGMRGKGCVHECSSCSRKGSDGKHAAPTAFAIRHCGDSEKRPV
jgi:hypothetical protein